MIHATRMQGPQAVFHQNTAAQPGYYQTAEGRLFSMRVGVGTIAARTVEAWTTTEAVAGAVVHSAESPSQPSAAA